MKERTYNQLFAAVTNLIKTCNDKDERHKCPAKGEKLNEKCPNCPLKTKALNLLKEIEDNSKLTNRQKVYLSSILWGDGPLVGITE